MAFHKLPEQRGRLERLVSFIAAFIMALLSPVTLIGYLAVFVPTLFFTQSLILAICLPVAMTVHPMNRLRPAGRPSGEELLLVANLALP